MRGGFKNRWNFEFMYQVSGLFFTDLICLVEMYSVNRLEILRERLVI